MIVLDTVTLIYWTLFPNLLTNLAKRAITDADTLVISSISIWEIAIKAKRGASIWVYLWKNMSIDLRAWKISIYALST